LKITSCVFALLAASLVPVIVRAANGPRPLTADEARGLVLEALPSKSRHLPGFGLDQYQDQNSPQFYFFTATRAGTAGGSAVIGNYAVDSLTGDVWSATTECEEEKAPTLRKLQAKIRLRIGLSDSDYHQLRIKRKGPLCS
jgi:hypothetical protein